MGWLVVIIIFYLNTAPVEMTGSCHLASGAVIYPFCTNICGTFVYSVCCPLEMHRNIFFHSFNMVQVVDRA